MNSILHTIAEHKKIEVLNLKKVFSLNAFEELISEQGDCRGFADAVEERVKAKSAAVIAECKKASPSKGVIKENYSPKSIAIEYEEAGACCISVLTDESFFQGKIEDLQEVKAHCQLPVIRKDFVVDAAQIYHSRAMGADCILLIMAMLGKQQFNELYMCAKELGVDILIETHTLSEIDIAQAYKPRLLGINNRDLKTFEVDLQITFEAMPYIPPEIIVVTESGIKTQQDVRKMYSNGVYSFLVGEAFMSQPSPGKELRQLFGDLSLAS